MAHERVEMDAATYSIAEQQLLVEQFTVIEAAGKLKISRSEVYKMHNAGAIKFAKFRGRTIVPGAEVLRILKEVAASAQ
jgi:excisionase family DNA binding protein